MKKTHTFRLALGLVAGIALAGSLSSCADMWLGTSTDLNFTQPGGFGIDFGVGGPLGGPATPPPPPLRPAAPAPPLRPAAPAPPIGPGGPGAPFGPGPGGPPPF